MIDWKYAWIIGPTWLVLFGGSIWIEYKIFMALSAAIKSAIMWC